MKFLFFYVVVYVFDVKDNVFFVVLCFVYGNYVVWFGEFDCVVDEID